MERNASTSPAPTAWDVIHAARRLSRRLEGQLDDALEELALSSAQFEILELLRRDRNAHAAALARRLGVSRQIASRLLAELDRAGPVELLPLDGGVRVPIVTQGGRRRIELAVDATAPIRERIVHLAPDRRETLVAIVEDLENAIRPPQRPWWLD